MVVGEERRRGELTIHLQHMYLAEVLVSIGVAAVVPHVDGGHLGDVQGAVIAKVLQQEEEEEEEQKEEEDKEEEENEEEKEESSINDERGCLSERKRRWMKNKCVNN